MGRMMAAVSAALCIIAGALPARADGPSAPTAVVKSYTGTLPPAAEGRRVFLKLNCYGCHGNNAAGGMGPNIRQAESRDIGDVVMGGGNGMPSFGRYINPTDIA